MADEDRKIMEEKIRSFHDHDAERNTLFTDLLNEYRKLMEKYDGESQQWQTRIAINRFVAVLIDADGAPFTDDILRSFRGGEMAASYLRMEVKGYIERILENSPVVNCSIWVHIFTDVNGLSRKLHLWDECNRNARVTRLVQEFNSIPLFNFVDVGEGKERVDDGVRETLRFFYGNPSCEQIILGGCHGKGYGNTLRQYKLDPGAFSKISLLETTHHSQDLEGFKRVRFSSVFRESPLPEKPVTALPAPHSVVLRIPEEPQVTSSAANSSLNTDTSQARRAGIAEQTPSLQPNSTTWVTIAKKDSVQTISTTKTAQHLKFIWLNGREERIDRPLPAVHKTHDQHLWDRIKNDGKVCNDYFLTGHCSKSDSCTFSHKGKLTTGQLSALAYRQRMLACKSGPECRDFDCYKGHHCMMDDCGRVDCKWSHEKDKHITYKYMEDGSIVNFSEKQPYTNRPTGRQT